MDRQSGALRAGVRRREPARALSRPAQPLRRGYCDLHGAAVRQRRSAGHSGSRNHGGSAGPERLRSHQHRQRVGCSISPACTSIRLRNARCRVSGRRGDRRDAGRGSGGAAALRRRGISLLDPGRARRYARGRFLRPSRRERARWNRRRWNAASAAPRPRPSRTICRRTAGRRCSSATTRTTATARTDRTPRTFGVCSRSAVYADRRRRSRRRFTARRLRRLDRPGVARSSHRPGAARRCRGARTRARRCRPLARLGPRRPGAQQLAVLAGRRLGAGRPAHVLLCTLQDGRRQHAHLRARRRPGVRGGAAFRRRRQQDRREVLVGIRYVPDAATGIRRQAALRSKSSAEAKHSTFDSARRSCRQPEEHHEHDRPRIGTILRRTPRRFFGRIAADGSRFHRSPACTRSTSATSTPVLRAHRRAGCSFQLGHGCEGSRDGRQPACLRRVACGAGKAHGPDLRALRRSAGRSGGAVAYAAVRSDGARRQRVRARHGRRQGPRICGCILRSDSKRRRERGKAADQREGGGRG